MDSNGVLTICFFDVFCILFAKCRNTLMCESTDLYFQNNLWDCVICVATAAFTLVACDLFLFCLINW